MYCVKNFSFNVYNLHSLNILFGLLLQNDLQEFYSIVEFCNPGMLGTIESFCVFILLIIVLIQALSLQHSVVLLLL